jgi:CheY-like chemotaxis protein
MLRFSSLLHGESARNFHRVSIGIVIWGCRPRNGHMDSSMASRHRSYRVPRSIIDDGVRLCFCFDLSVHAIQELMHVVSAYLGLRIFAYCDFESQITAMPSDLMMPEMDGIALLRAAREMDGDLVAIVRKCATWRISSQTCCTSRTSVDSRSRKQPVDVRQLVHEVLGY